MNTEPLILVPGFMCDARLFAPQVAHLSSRRAVTVHLPAPDAISVAAMAEGLLEAAPDRFALAGLSMGAIVAMEVLRRAPCRITRVAFMGANPAPDRPDYAAFRLQQIAAGEAGNMLSELLDKSFPRYLSPETEAGPHATQILKLCADMACDLGMTPFISHHLALMSRPDQTPGLSLISCPTLVLCGADDRVCPPPQHHTMHRLVSGSMLELVNGAGHLPPLEKPKATNQALDRWLAMT